MAYLNNNYVSLYATIQQNAALSFDVLIVMELPEEGIKNVIYLVPDESGNEQNRFKEYIYIDGAWECIGSTTVAADLTDYVKRNDILGGATNGVIKINGVYGTTVKENQYIAVEKASDAEIDARTSQYKPITPKNLEYAVKSVTYDKTEIDTMFDGVVESVLSSLPIYDGGVE